MIVYRKKTIPCIYSNLPFVRYHKDAMAGFIDCPDDLDLIMQLKKILRNELCISTLEGPAYFYIAADIPETILELEGKTYNDYFWNYYFYKTYDITCLLESMTPNEALSIKESGLNVEKLFEIYDNSSCYKYLMNTIDLYDYKERNGYMGVTIPDEMIKKLMQIEKRTIASFNLNKLKNNNRKNKPKKKNSYVTPKIRNYILQRDNYKCIFCGQTSDNISLEVNHIIPVNIINKLNLNKELLIAEYNLCTTCFECNRSKSDNLNIIDLNFYLERFKSSSIFTRLYGYLYTIKELQEKR